MDKFHPPVKSDTAQVSGKTPQLPSPSLLARVGSITLVAQFAGEARTTDIIGGTLHWTLHRLHGGHYKYIRQ